MNHQPSKRGQLEIMGLVLIVLLITIAMLFFIAFSLRQDTSAKNTFTRSQLATNFINSIQDIRTTCGDSMENLIQDCMRAQGPGIACNLPDGGSGNSCIFVEQTTRNLLNQTLQVWGKNYQFRVFIPGEDPQIEVLRGECLRDRDSHTLPIPQEGGAGTPISVRIDVC